jgi:adenylate cyclase class IV
MIRTTKDITVTLISGLEGTKWIKFATRTSTGQLTERAISSVLEHFKVQHNKLNRRSDLDLLTNK